MEFFVDELREYDTGVIAGLMSQPSFAMERKESLGYLKTLLEGKDVGEVKDDLTRGIVTDETLDKTGKIYEEIGIFFIDISLKGDV